MREIINSIDITRTYRLLGKMFRVRRKLLRLLKPFVWNSTTYGDYRILKDL